MALFSTYTTDFRAYRIYSTYSTYSKELGESGGSAAWRVRYSTYSTYSKDPGESGCSAAWRVRYSTYSTYSKDPGESGGSAAWRSFNAGQVARPGRLLCRAGGALQPLAKKSVLQSSPRGRTGIFFLGRIPTLARAWQAAGSDAGQVARPGASMPGKRRGRN